MKGISFTAPMALALWERRKTVTRRPVKGLDGLAIDYAHSAGLESPPVWFDFVREDRGLKRIKTPYRPGETVYVKETHHVLDAGNQDGSGQKIVYKADDPNWPYGWTPSIHMPEWASRLKLLITDVRAERLQEITEEEIIKEGFSTTLREHEACCDLREQYQKMWTFLYGSWEANPWVWRFGLKEVWRRE